MRSMRLAALTVAMTLAFSGLALARDHDDDHHRTITTRMITIKTGTTTVTMTGIAATTTAGGITTGITIAGAKASANEFESMSAGNASIATTATTAARFTTAIPAATPAGIWLPGRELWQSRHSLRPRRVRQCRRHRLQPGTVRGSKPGAQGHRARQALQPESPGLQPHRQRLSQLYGRQESVSGVVHRGLPFWL